MGIVTNAPNDKRQYLEQHIDQQGVRARVHMHPYVPSTQVTSLLTGGDLGIPPHTSLSQRGHRPAHQAF